MNIIKLEILTTAQTFHDYLPSTLTTSQLKLYITSLN